jgi:hypothetical protein
MFKARHAERVSTPATNLTASSGRTKDDVKEDSEPLGVLAELYELLEAYAPSWYTEAHRRRVQMALEARNRVGPKRAKAH